MRTEATRLALMGGAYGNVPALEACIERACKLDCGLLAFLGDATGCCGHSDRTLHLIADHFDVLIAGNHEQQAAAGAETCGCGYSDPEDERLGCLAHGYAMASLGEANRRWIADWPDFAIVTAPGARVLLCHGSPDRTNEFLYESQLDATRLNAWMDRTDTNILACTHTGLHWVRPLGASRLALNCGVVGKPDDDGDPAVHFAVLETAPTISVRIERVEYDAASWAELLAEEGVDRIFTDPLITGRWTTGRSSLPPAELARRHA